MREFPSQKAEIVFDYLNRFGRTNPLFNQLILELVQSLENKYYRSQLTNFINQHPSSSPIRLLAMEQIELNIHWLTNGLAENLDGAIPTEQ